jgi:orotidine-5'-phosphate decarboxylase
LDFDSIDAALPFAERLVGLAGLFKIGKQLFTAEGPEAVRRVSALGAGIFLDLKYHDIPNTVAGAVRAAASLPGVRLLNVHALGGDAMMRAAAEMLAPIPNRPKLLGVTVLTSTDAKTMRAVGISGTPSSRALALAKLAKKCGLDGVVASPHEVKALRRACGEDFVLAIGGIRPGAAKGQALVTMVNSRTRKRDDQSRIATPAETIRAGANYLIVGRPINASSDPVGAARAILDEIAEAEAAVR